MRFRPAHISVINRRARSSAVTGAAVGNLKAHQREGVPYQAAHPVPECQNGARAQGFASLRAGPLPAARRSGQTPLRWAAPAGTLRRFMTRLKKRG